MAIRGRVQKPRYINLLSLEDYDMIFGQVRIKKDEKEVMISYVWLKAYSYDILHSIHFISFHFNLCYCEISSDAFVLFCFLLSPFFLNINRVMYTLQISYQATPSLCNCSNILFVCFVCVCVCSAPRKKKKKKT